MLGIILYDGERYLLNPSEQTSLNISMLQTDSAEEIEADTDNADERFEDKIHNAKSLCQSIDSSKYGNALRNKERITEQR